MVHFTVACSSSDGIDGPVSDIVLLARGISSPNFGLSLNPLLRSLPARRQFRHYFIIMIFYRMIDSCKLSIERLRFIERLRSPFVERL